MHDTAILPECTTTNAMGLVERAGRNCYRSFDKAKPESAPKFIAGIVARGHESVIEHAEFCLTAYAQSDEVLNLLMNEKLFRVTPYFTEVNGRQRKVYRISGNLRMAKRAAKQQVCKSILAELIERDLRHQFPVFFGEAVPDGLVSTKHEQVLDERPNVQLWSLFTPTGLTSEELLIHGSATLYFKNVSRTLSHQLVRHRMASYSQSSQRYCVEGGFNYEIPPEIAKNWFARTLYKGFAETARFGYNVMRWLKFKAEDARFLLPGACDTEIVVTMPFSEWKNFLFWRDDSHSQWEIRRAAGQVRDMLETHVPQLFSKEHQA